MKRILTILLLAALFTVGSNAQTTEAPKWYDTVNVSGFADVYYAFNNNSPASHQNFVPGTGTSAKSANEFNVNLAALEIVHDAVPGSSPVGFHLSIVAGTGADVVHATEPEGYRHLYQASILYKPNDRLTFEGGVYPSHIGFEGFFSKDNWNYTRSWLGEFSPYYQTGLRTAYQFTPSWEGEVHLINGWQIISDNNDAKSIGLKIAYSKDRLSASFNTCDGPELANDDSHWRHFGNLIALYKVTPKLSLGGSLDRGHQNLPAGESADWFGVGGFARYEIDARNAVAFRAERYDDSDNVFSGTPQKLTEGTLTYEFRPQPNLILKFEARHDRSTEPVFDHESAGKSDSETLLVVGAVAKF